MHASSFAVPLLLVSLTACSDLPDAYPPPPQRKSLESREYLGRFVRMNEPNAEAYLVRDVSAMVEGGSWRWTYRRPELRFYVGDTPGLKFAMDFAIAEVTFLKTGPVTLSILLNDRPIQAVHCSKPGVQHVEAPIPAGILQPNAVNRVVIEPDKVWTSPGGPTLGFILVQAGFVE